MSIVINTTMEIIIFKIRVGILGEEYVNRKYHNKHGHTSYKSLTKMKQYPKVLQMT